MNDLRYIDNKLTKAIKAIITAVYLWSGLFWAGITIIYFYFFDTVNIHLAVNMMIADVFLTASLIMIYFRLYIIQLPFTAVGEFFYLISASEMINHAAKNNLVYKVSFEARYMPVVVILILGIVLAVLQIRRIIARREELNNRPSKSILDD